MSDYFDVNNEELLKDFFSEPEQQVETLESNILVLENDPTNHDAVDEIFRAAHTLKGGSATVEMTELAEFTHAVEDVLDELRSNTIQISEEIIDVLLSSIDIIKAMLEERSNGSVYEEDVDPIKNKLHSFVPSKAAKAAASAPKKIAVPVQAPSVAQPVAAAATPALTLAHPSTHLTEYDELELTEVAAGKTVWGVTVVFDESNPMNTVGGIQVFKALKSVGDVLKTIPDFDNLYEDIFHEQVVYFVASSSDADSLEDKAFIDDVVLAVDAQNIKDKPAQTQEVPAVAEPQASTSAVPTELPAPESYLTESDLHEMQSMCSAGEKLWGVTVVFDENHPMNSVGAIQSYVALKGIGQVIKSIPDFDELYDEHFYPQVVYYVSSAENADKLEDAAFLDDAVLAVDAKSISIAVKAPEPKSEVSQPVQVQSAPIVQEPVNAQIQEQVEAAAKPKKAAASPAASNTNNTGSILRVDSKRIDYLLNLVSETVITKAAFNQTLSMSNTLQSDFQTLNSDYKDKIREIADRFSHYVEMAQSGQSLKEIKGEINNDFAKVLNQFDDFDTNFKTFEGKFRSYTQNLGRISGELQEGVMKIRMVPISQIFSRFPRVVRDLSRELNKKINLVIEGEETELDKSVVEDLLDPIMHCVRNSVDHGVELPAERHAAGKSEEGTVVLRASNEGNMIVIEIQDDGKGIDVDSIRAKAIERGLIHSSKIISDEEAYQFIFDPGFSTAKAVTNVSGRGVGLDVVKTQIEKLKGSVVISSEKGVGTKFTIKLPLTLAIIQGLLVRVGTEVYSIPIASVIESQRINVGDLRRIDNYEVMSVRDEVISVLRLNRLFNIKARDDSPYSFIVIVGTSDEKLGIMVDALIGEEDVVIKPLTDQFVVSPGIAGASILGDGSVSLIIDVSQLLALGIKLELTAREVRTIS